MLSEEATSIMKNVFKLKKCSIVDKLYKNVNVFTNNRVRFNK